MESFWFYNKTSFKKTSKIITFWAAGVVEFLPVETAEPDFPVETAGVDPRRVSNEGSIDDRRDLFCQNKICRLSTSNVYKCFNFNVLVWDWLSP